MKKHLLNPRWFAKVSVVVAALVALFTLLRPMSAKAHCDSVQGPVVTAAKAALAAKDVNLVLPYIQPSAEPELIAAFEHTLEVRALGPEAQKLADEYFFETTVRLHRVGEGAAYTGLVDKPIEDPALIAADAALEEGDLDAVYEVLEQAVHGGVADRYAEVQQARKHASAEKTVAANRERVEAELGFEKYVYAIYTAAVTATHHEGEVAAAPAAHQH